MDRPEVSKVPNPSVAFWVTKVFTTAMGEATSDSLVHRLDPYVAVGIGFVVFAGSMVIQFSVRRYVVWVYWVAVAMVAVFGTMAADVVHIEFKVPYALSFLFYAVVLTVVFVAWYMSEGTISIHSIVTWRREAFYWTAVLATFAMGTALGDLTAFTLHLGFFSSGLLFLALFALPGIAYRWLGLNAVVAFWAAYVMTRPLGASFADWFGKPKVLGGLGFGSPEVAVIFAGAIAFMIGYMTLTDPGGVRLQESPAVPD
jgi:uncharacterized membrane-anchored protein